MSTDRAAPFRPLALRPLQGSAAAAMRAAWMMPEQEAVQALLKQAQAAEADTLLIQAQAQAWIIQWQQQNESLLQHILKEYGLSSQEGLVLLCLAEALLRIPDAAQVDRFIEEWLASGQWPPREPEHWWAKLALLGLSSLGHMMKHWHQLAVPDFRQRLGRPALREIMRRMTLHFAQQFVFAPDLAQARPRMQAQPWQRFSVDMLGEAALCEADARQYAHNYSLAISALAQSDSAQDPADKLWDRPGVSIKISALYAQYDMTHLAEVESVLLPRLLSLIEQAAQAGVPVTLDAEESERLEISLMLAEVCIERASDLGFVGVGLAVQAYQKRAWAVLHWVAELAQRLGHAIPVRLVKGAYWDSEIKRAQQHGWADYPVFTRKEHTDLSYLACSRWMLAHPEWFYTQCATHNAHSLAWCQHWAEQQHCAWEAQRLHGMGEGLYQPLLEQQLLACRVYAPVGAFTALLPYLVRRLLENGANQSFVQQLSQADAAQQLSVSPLVQVQAHGGLPHPALPQPRQWLTPERELAPGYSLSDSQLWPHWQQAWAAAQQASPVIWPKPSAAPASGLASPRLHQGYAPAQPSLQLSELVLADNDAIMHAFAQADAARRDWAALSHEQRAHWVHLLAAALVTQRDHWLALLVLEAGKTWADALAEWREAIDYCHYYVAQAARHLQPQTLPACTGEHNALHWQARGVWLAISPWNFPLAILLGQMVAALITGNTVVVKASLKTPRVALALAQLLQDLHWPAAVVQWLWCEGPRLEAALPQIPRLDGVVFTGAEATAKRLQRALAQRSGPIVPLIAETGGVNVMIADSTAHVDSLVQDALQSAMNSAGQRCSALRILAVQEDIAERVEQKLGQMVQELRLGDPADLAVDVGPVIDAESYRQLEAYVGTLAAHARCLGQSPRPVGEGYFFPPSVWAVDWVHCPRHEVFGPILHVLRWPGAAWEQTLTQLQSLGYGLTLGVHTRLPSRMQGLAEHWPVGNIYVNRNMIGAVVGMQPFGGEQRSGTGFKAGGPHYLLRFMVERCVSSNSAALGGNRDIYSLKPEAKGERAQ